MRKTKRKPATPFRIVPLYGGAWEAWHVDHDWLWGYGKTPFAALEDLKKYLPVHA